VTGIESVTTPGEVRLARATGEPPSMFTVIPRTTIASTFPTKSSWPVLSGPNRRTVFI